MKHENRTAMKLFCSALLALALCGFAFESEAAAGSWVRITHTVTEVSPPQVLIISNNVIKVFGTNVSDTTGRSFLRTIQVTGTNALYYIIGSETNAAFTFNQLTNVTATNYHGILAGGNAPRDGLGSVLDVSGTTLPIYVRAVTNATEISVVEYTQ